jgi:transcriptional regulator with XRE-family HTH domain/dephospho-CoA kinase
MIKNERQYRITKAQADSFSRALKKLEGTPPAVGVHPLLHKAQIDGLRGQMVDLQAELDEYESLRSGKRQAIEIESFDDLPKALIQARIAGGMTQEDLAAKVGIKHQQIQRYEATDYRSASLDRVGEIARALSIEATGRLGLPSGETSIRAMIRRLKEVGLDQDFVSRRLLPSPIRSAAEKNQSVQFEGAEAIRHVFGWEPAVLFSSAPLALETTASGSGRFKLPARAKRDRLSAYVVYAHYLALLVLEATADLEQQTLPQSALEFRSGLQREFGAVTFENVIRYIWRLGVPVLPLNDSGAFHGACWRVTGRNVIVLKQRTPAPARWLHDLLHELWHAANKPDLEEHPVIEDDELSPARRESEEEVEASRFAGDVMLDGRAEELAEKCVARAKGSVERLKLCVPEVARQEGVSIGALANYLAFRLSLQKINWWGAATNLQEPVSAFETTPRELLLDTLNLELLPEVDRRLLLRAVEPIVLGLSGRSGSGKTEVSKAIAHDLGWNRASFGDYVRSFARSQGLDPSDILVLQDLGEKLVRQGAEQFCQSVLTHFNWKSGEPLVIDGVRHEEIAIALSRLVAPLDFRLVHLDVDDETRTGRLLRRGTQESYVNVIEHHPTETQTITTLPGRADLRLGTTRPLDEVVHQIVTWVHEGDGELVA